MLQTDELVGMEHCWNGTDRATRRCRKKICPSVILPTKSPHRLDWPGLEPDLRGGRLATCTLSEVCFICTIFRDLSVLPLQVA